MTPRRVVEKCLMFKEELRITKRRVAPRDLQFVTLRAEEVTVERVESPDQEKIGSG
jgi:hypothetical protein